MDRSLKIKMLLEAGDRASRPLRDIANGGSRAAEALKATRDRLKQVEAAQADVAGFRQLKTGLRTTEQAMQAAQTRVGQLVREMAQAETPTRAMTRDLARAKKEAQQLTSQFDAEGRQLQQLRDRLRAAGVATTDLVRHERELRASADSTNRELAEQTRRLEQAADRQRRFGAARERFARTQNMATGMAAGGAAAIGTGVAMGAGIWRGVKAAQEYQSSMTDIAQKANLSRAEAEKMGAGLLVAAKAANQLPDALQAGVDTLSGFGLDPRKAVAMMTPIGRAATAYKAEIADLSAAAFAANDNLKVPVEQTARVIDIMAQAGKSGAFEIKDMAGAFPSLTAGYQALGQTGTGAVADLAAALQIARKGAGDSATAANNVANVIQKISSPATIKAFSKFGIDLPKALKKAYAEGKTPLEAIAELTRKATGGDLGKMGFLFEDAQVQQGLRPLIQNMEEYRRIRAEASGASGVTDTDFAERLKDSAEQSKQLEINAKALGITVGTLLLPTINAITVKATGWANRLSDLAQRHPQAAVMIGKAALAFSALFIVMGAGKIAIAGILGPIGMVRAAMGLLNTSLRGPLRSLPALGRGFTGMATGLAKSASFLGRGLIASGGLVLRGGLMIGRGLLSIAGFAARAALMLLSNPMVLIIGGIALALGLAAYAIWKNWDKISAAFGAGLVRLKSIGAGIKSFFGGLWGEVKAGFGGGIAGIATTILNFSPLGLLYRAIAPALRWLGFDMPARFSTFGRNMIAGLIGGITGMLGRLRDTIVGAASSAAAWFKSKLGIRSPSRVFMAFGGHIVGGLNAGIDRDQDSTIDRVRQLTRRMAAAAAVPALATAGLVTPGIAAAETLAARNAEIRIVDTASRRPATDTRVAASTPGGRGAGGMAPMTVSITINPPAGADPEAIAKAVREELDKLRRGPPPGASSTFLDPPDWI